jgi:TolB-like protein/Tfp pilus assembly protein PilF
MRWTSFLHQLRERKLVQWALGYLAGAWVIVEFADLMTDTFGWPVAVLRVLTILLAFSFLGVVVFAWFHGEKGHQRVPRAEVLLLAVIAAAALLTAWRVGAPPVEVTTVSSGAGAAADERDVTPLAAQPADERKSIAVLPLANLSADTANDYFSDGITEDIIARLSQIESLRVISRTSVMQYKGTEKTIPQIGQELGVEYVLEGSVRRDGDKVRIVAQLIDARTDEHVLVRTYDRDLESILAVQAEVAEEIARALEAELSPSVLADLRGPARVDPEAYSLYARGRQMTASDNPEERAHGTELLTRAIERDSTISVAYGALAEALAPPPPLSVDPTPDVPPPPAVENVMRRVITAHGRAPEVQTFVVRRAMQDWDFEAAEAAAKRAIEANPNYAAAHHSYGMLLARTGRYEEALQHLKAAQSLDPRSASVHEGLGEVLYAMGRFDEAIAALREAIDLEPRSVAAHVTLGLAHQARGQQAAAEAALRRASELSDNSVPVQGYLGYVLATAGKTDEARDILRNISRSESRRSGSAAAAQIHAALGETDEALDQLRRAVGLRSVVLLSPAINRMLEKLHDLPEFEQIMRSGPPGPTGPQGRTGTGPIPPRRDTTRR